jgi:Methyltransferase domain
MSFAGKIIRATGVYEVLKSHFIESMLIPFATEGQISIQESKFLGEIVRSIKLNGDIIEVGTLFGRSTRVIIDNKKTEQKLITVDRFSWNPIGLSNEQHKQITHKILEDAINNANVDLKHMDKSEFYRSYKSSPALVFLDADHSYEGTKADIDWALSLNADIICGHDYTQSMPGVMKAVDESGGIDRLVDSLWILKKT